MSKQNHMQFLPRLMGPIAAAHYLGMSPSKLRTLAIPSKADGGNVLYERSDLDDYADKMRYRDGFGITGSEAAQCDAIFGQESD